VAGKDVISFSAPSNGADFSTINGGGSFGYFGDKLAYSFSALRAAAGYLFVFGDSSTDLISNVQLSGSGTPESPYTTNFNYENIDPQVGQRFPRPVGVLGRYMTMFNGAGVFLMQGGDAQPIGYKVTNIHVRLSCHAAQWTVHRPVRGEPKPLAHVPSDQGQRVLERREPRA
jgi:hypothetical protein